MSSGSTVFCYGTLLFPEVMSRVAGAELVGHPAVVEGWARYCVRRQTFPALVAQPGARTEGAVFSGVDAAVLARLDAFEGPLYVRRALEVERTDGGRLFAQVWVLAPGREAELSSEPWDLQAFAARDLRAFLARVVARGTPYAHG